MKEELTLGFQKLPAWLDLLVHLTFPQVDCLTKQERNTQLQTRVAVLRLSVLAPDVVPFN